MQTTLCCSASALASVFLLILGLMIASDNLRYQGEHLATEIVPMPKISMASKQGPWPACVGMTGEDCVSYIQENTEGLIIDIIPEGSIVTKEFRTDRVRVWVDENGIVVTTPKKG